MGYNYAIDHTRVNYTIGNSGRLYIVLHYTGNNTDTAKANANYFRDANRGASAHLFVDESDVYEVVSLNNTAWAVGVDSEGIYLDSVLTPTLSASRCVPPAGRLQIGQLIMQ